MHILIKGRVQGVFFRKYTQEAAARFGLTGYVKNTREGHVEAEVSGPKQDIDKFTEWCYTGSPKSEVKEVIITPVEFKKYPGFKIRY